MGCCYTKRKFIYEQVPQVKKQISESKSLSLIHTNLDNKRINECLIKPSQPFEAFEPDISKELSKKICKIGMETLSGDKFGTGFFLKFILNKIVFIVLFLMSNFIQNKKIIYIAYDNYKGANIKLDERKRYIKQFKKIGLDITIIEIIDEDNIPKNYFLLPEPEVLINNRLINSEIYIPQYIERKELKNAKGIIKDMFNYEFIHLANTIPGSSGSPIFLQNCSKVFGIHKAGIEDKKENCGDFIYPVINIIKQDIRKKKNNGMFKDGKYIWEDGKYYIGEF